MTQAIDLEQALRQLAAGQISRADVRSVLSASRVVVPGVTPDQGRDLQLPVVELGNGRTAVPLFSSPQRLAEAGGPDEAAAIPFDALAAGWPAELDAVLDPGHPWALLIPAEAVGEPSAVQVPAGEEAAFRQTMEDDAPAGLFDEVAALLASEPEVRSAWTAVVAFPNRPDTREQLLIALEFDGDDLPAGLTDRLGPVLGPHTRDHAISVTRARPDDDSLMSQAMRPRGPFYERD